MSARAQRIVLLGDAEVTYHTGTHEVRSLPWSRAKAAGSLADFDVVILSLLGSPFRYSRRDGRRYVQEGKFLGELLTAQLFRNVLEHGGKIFILGDPRFSYHTSSGSLVGFLDWTGLTFLWTGGRGEAVVPVEDPETKWLRPYTQQIKSFEYSLKSAGSSLASGFVPTDPATIPRVITKELKRTRFGEAVGSIHWRLPAGSAAPFPAGHSNVGPLVLLPRLSLSPEETHALLLSEVLGVELHAKPPAWTSEVQPTKAQTATRERLADVDGAIVALGVAREGIEREHHNATLSLGLLFQTGHALEQIVLSSLKQLGAEVTLPDVGNKEDGWIAVEIDGQIHEGVLEIKATKADQFGESGIRQLLDWVNRGVIAKKKKFKPIFIGNSAIERIPHERPYPFSES